MPIYIHVNCGCGFNADSEGNSVDDAVKVLEEAEAHVKESKHTVTIQGTVRP